MSSGPDPHSKTKKSRPSFRSELSEAKMTIPTNDLVSGMYILHLTSEEGEINKVKILIE
jgi:hypothetical protein